MYLAVAGNIGAGKSTLTGLLSARYHLTPVYEAVDENPYLEDFYADMPRYAFHSQIFFLAKRLEQHLRQVNPGNRLIQDRTIYEDADVFAHNLYQEGVLSARDYASYCRLYQAMLQALRPPDLLVYLRASVPTLRGRIRQRGRAYERAIPESYLTRLNDLYERWTASYDLSQLLVVETDERDFVRDEAARAELFATLEQRGLSAPVLGSG